MLMNEIGPILSELGCFRCTPAAGSSWYLHIPTLHEARARLQEDCLTFLSPPLLPAAPWTTVQQNSELGPALRLILDRAGNRRLSGETLLLPCPGERLKVAEKIRGLFDAFANGMSTVSGNLQANKTAGPIHTPSAKQDLSALAEELDRPVQEHDSELLLDCGAGERTLKIRVRSDMTRLFASVALLKSKSLSQESLSALSLLFLRMSSSYRLVRAAATAADRIVFDFEVALFPSALADEVDAALDCLSLLAGSCLAEVGVLQQADAAKAYLAMSRGEMVNPDQKGGESCD